MGNLARHGFVVVASQFRGNGTIGLEKYPGDHTCPDCNQAIGGLGREEYGGSDVNDVLTLIPLLESLPEVDAGRLGIWGHSRGGMMTYLALCQTDRFKAAVVGAGVADLESWLEQRPKLDHVFSDLIPDWNDPVSRQEAKEARSAVLWADKLSEQTPILIIHGTADWRVDPTQALDMSHALLNVSLRVKSPTNLRVKITHL